MRPRPPFIYLLKNPSSHVAGTAKTSRNCIRLLAGREKVRSPYLGVTCSGPSIYPSLPAAQGCACRASDASRGAAGGRMPRRQLTHLYSSGGPGGIRTLGTLVRYAPLAKVCFRPLSHRSSELASRGGCTQPAEVVNRPEREMSLNFRAQGSTGGRSTPLTSTLPFFRRSTTSPGFSEP